MCQYSSQENTKRDRKEGSVRLGLGLPIWVMSSHMGIQRCPPCKRFVTVWVVTFIRTSTRMRPSMSSQTARVAKRFAAAWVLARVRTLTSVYT